MKKLLLHISSALGIILILNAVFLTFVSNMNFGVLMVLLLGIILFVLGMFLNKINKWIKTVLFAGIVLAVAFSSFLFIYGISDNVTYKEDAVIVLGAGIKGETVSLVLKDRLDAVINYHNQNPDAVIIVTGGQGPQEDITEALAMEKYLIAKGVNKDKIIKEERATSTFENFTYSKNLLDEHFNGSYNIAFISNEYHIYRAGNIAKNAGFGNIGHIHSNTRWYTVVPGTLRECLAVVKFWVLKK